MKNGASDRLFHYGESDETLSFDQLMALYDRQITEELHVSPDDDEQTKRDFPRFAKEMREARDMALEMYHRHILEAAKEMQFSENEYLQGIGRALESGDWSQVCI